MPWDYSLFLSDKIVIALLGGISFEIASIFRVCSSAKNVFSTSPSSFLSISGKNEHALSFYLCLHLLSINQIREM